MEHVLTRDGIAVRICAATGKIVAMESHGRSWLVPPPSGSSEALAAGALAQANRFSIDEAWGADECFPTVAAYGDSSAGHSHNHGARDHGEIWGRRCRVTAHATSLHDCAWALPFPDAPGFRRELRLPGDGRLHVRVVFPSRVALARNGLERLEALYAFHALFAAETNTRLFLFDDEPTHPRASLRATFPPPMRAEARKFYAAARAGVLEHPDGSRCVVRLGKGLPGFGIWWCNNGWGDGREHRTIGLEPTTHLSDGPIFTSYEVPLGFHSKQDLSFTLEFPS
jgi:hypothetical protein